MITEKMLREKMASLLESKSDSIHEEVSDRLRIFMKIMDIMDQYPPAFSKTTPEQKEEMYKQLCELK